MKIEEFIKQMRQTMSELTIFHMECDLCIDEQGNIVSESLNKINFTIKL